MAGVLVAIDWENIRKGLANFVERITAGQVCAAFETVAKRFGDYRGGTVFGDWTLRSDEARVFEDHGLQAYNVLRSRSGKDRSDPAIILEVYDWIRERPDVDAFILGSGDSDFKELIRRGRQRGKQVVICAVGQTIAGELHTMTATFPLESELGLTLRQTTPATLPGFALDEEVTKWGVLIHRLDSMERELPYVVLSYLRSLLSPAWGAGPSELEQEAFLQDALAIGILETYQVDNPKRPGRKVTVVRLNREHDTVRQMFS